MAAPSIKDRLKAGREKKPEYRDVDVVLDGLVAAQVTEIEDKIDGLEAEVTRLEEEIAPLREEREALHPQLPTRPVREKEIDDRIAGLQEQIDKLQEEITPLEEQRDTLRGETLTTLRFEKAPGDAWSQIAATHPPRVDVAIDRISGYNYQAAAIEAAPLCGYALGEDGSREDLDAEDWADLFRQISGRETENIAASLWELNDWAPRRRIDAARKGSSAPSGNRSS